MNRLLIGSAILLLNLSNPCFAESVAVPVGQQGNAQAAERPARGSSSARVVERFGTPHQQSPAVGDPAISRWTYESFTVFFEDDYVIHSVLHP